MSKRASAIIFAGFCSIFVSFAVRYAYGLLLPHMLPALEISKAQAGTIYSGFFLMYMIFSPILGIMADRSDARLILTFFIGMLGLGTFLMSFATSLFLATAFFALAGLGQSAGWVPVVTLVQRWVSDRRRGMAIAIVDLGSGTGIIVVSLVLPLIVAAVGWRGAWSSLGILGLAVAVLNFFLISNPPSAPTDTVQDPDHRSADPTPGLWQVYRMVMGAPAFWLVGIAYLLIGFCILIPFTFLTTFAIEALFVSYSAAASLIGVIALAGICGKLSLGHLSDKVGRVRIMILCGALTCAGTLGMAMSPSFAVLIVSTALFGIGYGALWPVYAAASRDFFKKEFAGRVIGLWTLFLGLGSVVSPVLAGWLVDASGRFMWAFILSAVAAALSVVALIPAFRIEPVSQQP